MTLTLGEGLGRGLNNFYVFKGVLISCVNLIIIKKKHNNMKRDTLIFDLIEKEKQRQINGIELIASENFVSPQVLEAMGSVMTNKYAEGYPGNRYYGGCEIVDQTEQIAIDRLNKLFNAEYANVQPHSGAQANMAVFMAVLKPGDTFMGLIHALGGN